MPRIPFEGWTESTARLGGREVDVFGGCNYLGLAHRAEAVAAVRDGAARWGLTTTASRETTGNTTAHEAMEREIAAFLGKPAAILTTEGYTANIALGQGLAGGRRVAVVDERSHSSVVFGMGAPGLVVETYRHLDAGDAARAAGRHDPREVVVMTDGVFAADGGVAPAGAILRGLAPGAMLVIDDCHGFCTLGPGGRGVAAMDGVSGDPRVVITTTFGKGLGAYGGAVVGEPAVVEAVRERSLVYRGTTPCPPPMIEGARAALRVLAGEPGLVERLGANVREVRRVLWAAFAGAGVEASASITDDGSPRVPIFVFWLGSAGRMRAVQEAMLSAGVFVPLIDYPGGPVPWYFRATVSACHTAAQIGRLGEVLGRALRAG
ncbi:MAG: pyridoxal phosphate-dependent aminotransferase family protein [Phycisphaeraceae bacterium]|nr:MAG: pyridoxal phosphate-dependent aminotransferase family protein [Phycisphaeraceae bacterium]